VVIGYFEPHAQGHHRQNEGLEIVPRSKIDYRGREFEEMDTEAILRRNPEVCAVDEFPHTNIPGSARSKRWKTSWSDRCGHRRADDDEHPALGKPHDQIRDITGVAVRETIPDWVVKQAEKSC